MKLAAVTALATLMWTACTVAGPLPPAPVELGQPFALKIGESAHFAGQALRVGFAGVVADSRCPKGEHCVWAGDATVRVWLQQGAEQKQSLELHTAVGAAQAARVGNHELRLLRLDPYPVSGRDIASAEQLATLALSPATGAAPER